MKRAELLAEALALPERQRIELAAELLASAKAAPGVLEEGEPETTTELERRLEDLETGRVKAIPMAEAMRALRGRRAPRRGR